ncbi:replicative DNA helicase [Silvibacterium sp.]|uniref:replicative DNA helicase n=1 Tax=Silvibacterium sp. TaxID=1964179 RepID=UPI0039E555F2
MIYCEDSEKAILGGIMLESEAYDVAAEQLTADDFALDSHRRIFACMSGLTSLGQPIDLVTLTEALNAKSELSVVGGASYLASLTEGLPRRLNIASYCRIVLDKSLLRKLYLAGSALVTGAEDPGADPEELSGTAERLLMELRAGAMAKQQTIIAGAVVPLLNRLHQERTRTSDLLGLPTGIPSFDLVTRGLHAGEITQIGSQSGGGKSAVMIQAAIENCRQGVPVLLFSLEMTREQILRRMISAISGVPFPRVRDPKWASQSDMDAIQYAAEKIADWPLHVVDASGIRIEKLVATARLAVRRDGVKLVCVDYAQIVSAEGRDERLRVASVSRGLTRLAKDEQVALMVLSQLARADRSNVNRRPTISDLRESSQLENDAHVIALLHRPWDADEGRLSSNAELIIAKQRSGETGIFPLLFDRRTLMFREQREAERSAEQEALPWRA